MELELVLALRSFLHSEIKEASLSSGGTMDFDLGAAVDKDSVKKSEANEVEGIFGFGKKDKDKDKDKSMMIRKTTWLKKNFFSTEESFTPHTIIPDLKLFRITVLYSN
ncbi:hypothetical protein KOW79_014917 [Hemibagrus wyckioides]|uniref:Uncharacterized protein n=1 Tax=Hemibagrus wyckioides TaxID=337641 RepID=A0A9D3NGN1_9TELE|nr:hypothetical protein KOW79_014917 [Hemibagrus wyckioides]